MNTKIGWQLLYFLFFSYLCIYIYTYSIIC